MSRGSSISNLSDETQEYAALAQDYILASSDSNNMSESAKVVLTGGCMCGSVTYTSTTLPSDMTNCHCITCRKLSGGPFITWVQLPTAAISWVGTMKKHKYSDIAERGHCPECGSQLLMQYHCQPERVSLSAGSIDEKSVSGTLPKPGEHIFVGDGEKAGWYDIEDRLPKYSKFDGPFQRKLERWKELLKAPGLG